MAHHTSWRVGGPADCLYLPADLDDLAAFLKALPANEPLHWVGLGSNLLVRDGGVRGTVIMTSGTLGGLALTAAGTVRAEAGVPCAKLARFCVQNGLRGGEFLAGIPGTVGGALAMNAGCHGSETWQFVEAVETLDRHGQLRRREPKDYRIAYRSVKGAADGIEATIAASLPRGPRLSPGVEARAAGQGRPASGLEGEWFVAGHFRFPLDDKQEGRGLIKRLLARRGATQPTQLPNAGSVFKNPPNDHAARLIEASGLKGVCEGRACVSKLHANFIVNTGGASAADIERLIARVQTEVAAKQGVQLETEVRVIGEAR